MIQSTLWGRIPTRSSNGNGNPTALRMIAEVVGESGGDVGSWIQTTTTIGTMTGGRDMIMTPLLLSTLAGLSTCLGAAVVFWTKPPPIKKNGVDVDGYHRTKTIRMDKQLAFSLALAGSVMITVSVASILPEAFLVDGHGSKMVTDEIGQRIFSLGLGCALYLLLSKFAFPEPGAILLEPFKDDIDVDDEPQVPDEEIATPLPPHTSLLLAKQQSGSKTFQRKRSTLSNIADVVNTNNNTSRVTIIYNNTRASSNISNNTKAEEDCYHNNDYHNDEQSSLVTRTTSSSAEDDYQDEYDKTAIHPELSQRNTSQQSSSSLLFLDWKGRDLENDEARRNWRVAMLLFISLLVHNFPEGLAVAASAMHSPRLGWTTTLAIALHNIPEGVAIAIPCIAARPDAPWLAFLLASASGLAEPLGAGIAIWILNGRTSVTTTTTDGILLGMIFNMKNVLAFVAGIMIMVAVIELFPEAKRHMKQDRWPGIAGTFLGIVIMLASDAYLEGT